ncbi:hypothetical protein DM02DRAFT_684494 [Periconia macrospinosa]|uniref:Uncharacterized protein n=1 Tax=Periconia macrospinosa TaxID=97972 RepID=A0A2V1DJC8_9PLEO|nr:hypothetical protein DM02DRAFT_684494 [Periconia macrospinosa]
MSCNQEVSSGTGGDALIEWTYSVLQEITTEMETLNTELRNLDQQVRKKHWAIRSKLTIPSLEAAEMELTTLVNQMETGFNRYRQMLSRISSEEPLLLDLFVSIVMTATGLTESDVREAIEGEIDMYKFWEQELEALLVIPDKRKAIERFVEQQREIIKKQSK